MVVGWRVRVGVRLLHHCLPIYISFISLFLDFNLPVYDIVVLYSDV
jgi:hypothetical protein